jgi:hypothetical protein
MIEIECVSGVLGEFRDGYIYRLHHAAGASNQQGTVSDWNWENWNGK